MISILAGSLIALAAVAFVVYPLIRTASRKLDGEESTQTEE